MDKMSEFWSVNEGTFYCLYDRKRTLAFRRAIKATVQPGDVVVELGAGSGVLSMFAADAGAERVYAVELDETNLRALRASIAVNGYEDKVTVLAGDATEISLPTDVDVIICEMVATGLLEELQIPAMNNALRFAKPQTKVLLQEYHIFADLVSHKNEYYGKRFEAIRYEFPDKPSLTSRSLSAKQLIAEVDFRQPNESPLVRAEFPLTISTDGDLNGLRISASTIFSDDSQFGYSISYSFPVILPVEERPVFYGDEFQVAISYSMCEGPQPLHYTVVAIG